MWSAQAGGEFECVFDCVSFMSVCMGVHEWEMRVLHQARPPSGPLLTHPHNTRQDHSRFACKTWYKRNYTLMNAQPDAQEVTLRGENVCCSTYTPAHPCMFKCSRYITPTLQLDSEAFSYRAVILSDFWRLQMSSVVFVKTPHGFRFIPTNVFFQF